MPPRVVLLETPPLPLLVDTRVFDAFNWSPSRVLEWRSPSATIEINAFDPDLPLRLAFVFRAPFASLPAELARLHTGRGYDLTDEMALAPYAIDDATDQLFEQRRDAHSVFWLAADNVNALFWGLHDWAHFHSHGAFEERAATELQCDASALTWLWVNRASIPLDAGAWETLRAAVALRHEAFTRESPSPICTDLSVLDAVRIKTL